MSEETLETTEVEQIDAVEQSDSGGSFDMNGAVESISADLFGKKHEEPADEPEQEEAEIEDHQEVEEAEEVEEQAVAEDDGIELPTSWKKDMADTWKSMSKEAKEYILQREEQMRAGLERDRENATLGRDLRDVVTPYQSWLKQNGVSEKQMIGNLLNAHYKLTNAPMDQKKQYIQQLAQGYGIKFDGEWNSQEIDPIVKNLTDKINSLEYYVASSQQQAQQAVRTKVTQEINAFAESHPYFDDVADEVAVFVESGLQLEDAYERAVWANPLVRQKELERIQQEREVKVKEELEKKMAEARKAKTVNVRTKDTGKSPTAPKGSMFDTLNETYREIQQRNRS